MSSQSQWIGTDGVPYAIFPDVLGESVESKASGVRERVATAFGVLIGFVFLYFAYKLGDGMPDLLSEASDLVVNALPASADWIWVWMAVFGLLASLGATVISVGARKEGYAGLLLAIPALCISGALVAILGLDHFKLATDIFGMEGDFLWPDGKPSYFFPVSALGVMLPMVSLVLTRGGNRYDRSTSVALSCVPLVLLAMPYIWGFDASDIVRWMPALLTVSGFSLIVCGPRLHTYLSRVGVDSMDYWSSRAYIGILGFVGLVAWFVFDAGQPMSHSTDSVWILLFLSNVGMSVLMLSAVVNGRNDPSTRPEYTDIAMILSGTALVLSTVPLVLLVLDMPDLIDFPRTMFLHLVAMAGVGLVMVAISVRGIGTIMDKLAGILAAAAPPLVVLLFVLLAFLSGTGLAESPRILSGGYAFGMYLLFAVCVFVSGLKVETFMTAQWPIVHEKLRLLMSRSRQVGKDVLKNPMGLIGTVILIFFVIVAIFGPVLAPYEVDATRPGVFEPYLLPSSEHWMGTDVFGHDILSSLLYGARTSIVVGMFAAVIASVVGAAVGLYSGYVGGWKDEVLMRINDVMLSIPWLVLMILIAGLIGTISLTVIILIIGLTGWSATARLVRAQVLSLRERQYIERAKAIGSGDMHIIKTHILPNSFPLVFANTILTVAVSILSEATLSFLHMRPYGSVTWGTMLSYAYECSAFQLGLHYWIVMPGLCIVFLVLGFTLMGYALDEVLNPRLRKR